MIRFAWLQIRTQAAVTFGALAVIAIVFAVTGPHLVHLYNTTVATCQVQRDCPTVTTAFLNTDGPLQVFAEFLLLVVPVVIGVFWGAPLIAREFENGTYRVAWTQSVTRAHWLAVKLGLGALATMVVAGLLSLSTTWWFSRTDLVRGDRFSALNFGVRGVNPIGYAVFAFALGAIAGLLTRRTVPAMLATLVGVVAARLTISSWVRPNLVAPLHKSVTINATSNLEFGQTPAGTTVTASTRGALPGEWLYSNRIVDKAGHVPTNQFVGSVCRQFPRGGATSSCITSIASKFHEVVTYQPASAYWTIQSYETAIFIGLAVALCGVGFWRIHHLS